MPQVGSNPKVFLALVGWHMVKHGLDWTSKTWTGPLVKHGLDSKAPISKTWTGLV